MMRSFACCLGALALFSIAAPARAATVNLPSCGEAEVKAAIAAAADGDTIACPAGSWSWANVDIVNRNITLKGAGIGQTIISITAPGGIEATSSNTKAFRVTGFTFASTGNFSTDNGKAMMRIQGGKGWRVDHNRFEIFSNKQNYDGGNGIYTRNDVSGLIDNNQFVKGGGSGCMHASTYPEGTGGTAWGLPSQLGSFDHTVFIEDNYFHNPGNCPDHNPHAVYGQNGGVFVFRHNEIHNMNGDAHGFCATYGTREWEISNNRWMQDTGNSLWAMLHMRGGTGVIYGNSLTGGNVSHGIYWNEYRVSSDCGASVTSNVPGFGSVTASSSCPSTEGYPCAQQIGRGQNNSSDPAYVWNNTNFAQMSWDPGTQSYIVQNRDFFMTGPKPGYTSYPYPHPLQGAAPPTSDCDVNSDGSTNVSDIQLCVNQAIGMSPCTADINNDGSCNVIDVQRVVNTALGGACVTN